MNKVEEIITSLLPDEGHRKLCLSLFLQALNKANSFGSNKWGAYCYREGVRLLVGNLIVFTVHKTGIWLALDKQLLNEKKEKWMLLEESGLWRWENGNYSEYKPVPSKNGYYFPSSEDSEVWPIIQEFHFEYLKKVANKYEWLNVKSQSKHTPELLLYLKNELGQSVPRPNYESIPEDNIFSDSGALQDIEEFKITHKELTETAREAIVQSRIGQGIFRDNLKKYWGEKCAITGCELVKTLKASHIKPWRCSNNIERLDVYNGLLLIPNLDSAFDYGYISFDNNLSLTVT